MLKCIKKDLLSWKDEGSIKIREDIIKYFEAVAEGSLLVNYSCYIQYKACPYCLYNNGNCKIYFYGEKHGICPYPHSAWKRTLFALNMFSPKFDIEKTIAILKEGTDF